MTALATSSLPASGAPHRHPGSLLKELDLDRAGFLSLISGAAELKRAKYESRERPRLTGRNFALIFEKDSTRTRCAFEVAAADQGARTTYLGPSGSHIGTGESIRDTARVLGRMFDGIEYRGFSQSDVETLAEHAGVPVWNGLTDQWHPTQMLADVLTMLEHTMPAGRALADVPELPGDIRYCFTGDGRSNVARSLLITGALLGMDVRIAAPATLAPPADVVASAQALAAESGARLLVTDDVTAAVRDADFVYTDVWVSMGESPEQWASRVPLLRPYRVTAGLMDASGNPRTKFMHCLPALHDLGNELGRRLYEIYELDGAEVTNDVFESTSSVVFDQAENRLHTIKALLVNAFVENEKET